MKKLIITSLVLFFALGTNAQNWWGNSKRVKGNGKTTSITRSVESYDGLVAGGSFDVILVKGKEGKITLEGEENLLPYILTEVKKGKLKITVEKGINLKTTKRMVITVPIKEINKVSLGGSGNIKSDFTLKGDEFDVSLGGSGNIHLKLDVNSIKSAIGGSGNIELSGKADSIKSSIAGSGSIKAYDLQVNSIKASIAGSGDVRISVKDEIKATVAGSGSVYYKGNPPKVKTTSVGSGSVISKN